MIWKYWNSLGLKNHAKNMINFMRILNFDKSLYTTFLDPKYFSTHFYPFYHFLTLSVVLFLLSSSGVYHSTILLNVMPQALTLAYIFFKSFALFTFILSYMSIIKSDMNNSLRIIFIKTNIIKATIIKTYTKNTHLITWKCNITRIFITKEYIIICE